MINFIDLTMISSSNVFPDKRHIAPRLSLVNIPDLNKLLRSEIFISEDGQLWAIHLILNYEPLSRAFQDASQAIRVGDPRIARIDVFMPGFLARRDLPPIELPLQRSPCKVAAPREEIASSRLSLKVEIDQFRLEEEGEVLEKLVELLDSEVKFDRSSAAHSSRLLITQVDRSFEEEEDMALNTRRGLEDILAERNKGSSSKEASKTQFPPSLPLPPLPSLLGLHPDPNLQKKKRKENDIEEGEIVLPKGWK